MITLILPTCDAWIFTQFPPRLFHGLSSLSFQMTLIYMHVNVLDRKHKFLQKNSIFLRSFNNVRSANLCHMAACDRLKNDEQTLQFEDVNNNIISQSSFGQNSFK